MRAREADPLGLAGHIEASSDLSSEVPVDAARPPPLGLLFLCRPGFEPECAAEVQSFMAGQGVHGYCKTVSASGYGVFHPAGRMPGRCDTRALNFVRQGIWLYATADALPERDRLAPLLAVIPSGPFGAVWLETPDTKEGKAVQAFCRQFAPHLERALRARGTLVDGEVGLPRLHVFFPHSRTALVGVTNPEQAWPWPGGVLRLKMPREAPSRSTLKLDEAFQTFLTAEERTRWLRTGLTAVDLGAAPGGWTWQLVRHGLHVTAVDNGAMSAALMATGQVEHLREDGFRYRPPRPVEWLVCDMVEQPQRVAALVAAWLVRGDCRRAIFNLKLPMKKRLGMVQENLVAVRAALDGAGLRYTLRCRQLYHDREEVTAYVTVEAPMRGDGSGRGR